jgi:hypothetical protein
MRSFWTHWQHWQQNQNHWQTQNDLEWLVLIPFIYIYTKSASLPDFLNA